MAEYNNRRKKKVCMMCTGKQVNYKDPDSLKRYTNEKRKHQNYLFRSSQNKWKKKKLR